MKKILLLLIVLPLSVQLTAQGVQQTKSAQKFMGSNNTGRVGNNNQRSVENYSSGREENYNQGRGDNYNSGRGTNYNQGNRNNYYQGRVDDDGQIEVDDYEPYIYYKKFRLGIDAGFTYRTAKMDESVDALMKDFLNKMRAGFLYGCDLHGFFPFGLGLGGRFTGHHYSRTEMGLKAQVNTYYIAPSMMWRMFTRNSDVFYFGYSIGYVYFDEKMSYQRESLSLSNGGLGATYDIGYDIRLRNNSFIGFKFTITSGTVFITDMSGEKTGESLNAADLSVGFRF